MTSGTMLSPATVSVTAGRSRVTMRMLQRPYVRTVVLLDAAVIALAVGGGYLARFGGDEKSTGGSEIPYVVVAPALVLTWLVTLKMLRCYDNRVLGYGADEYRRVSAASFRLAGGVAIAGYLADVALTNEFAIPTTVAIAAASIWTSLRIALPLEDRADIETVRQHSRHVLAAVYCQIDVAAHQDDLEELIRSAGFYKNKAKNIKEAARVIVEEHHGQVPQSLDELVSLAGVGRKTANVVLGNAYDIISGIVVDTHVTRLSNRLGWVKTENAVIIERELQKIIPHKDWILLSHWLISHGRAICKARRPKCEVCFLQEICPKRGVSI